MINRQSIEPAFAKQVILDVAKCWGFTRPQFIHWFENVVYQVVDEDQVSYIRLTSAKRRTKKQIRSELDILHFLKAHQLPVTEPIPSLDGDYVLEFEYLNEPICVCAFTACLGQAFRTEPPKDLCVFFYSAGHLMGRLHTALNKFTKPSGFTRFEWFEDRWKRFAEVIPQSETEAWIQYDVLKDWWDTLDKNTDFGLIHGDFTINNLRYQGTHISLFDFDGSCDHWYGYELGCFLHFFSDYPQKEQQLAYYQLLDGYATTSTVSDLLVEQIPIFGKMKLLRSFMILAEEWGFENLTPDQKAIFALKKRMLVEPSPWSSAERFR